MKVYALSRWLVLLLALCAVALFFLPFSSMTKDFREEYTKNLGAFENYKLFGDEVDLAAKDWIDLSMFDFTKILIAQKGDYHIEGIMFIIVCCAAVSCVVWALFKIPVLVLVSDIAMFIVYRFLVSELNPALFNGTANRVGGIAYQFYYVVMILLAVCTVVLFFAKRQHKKAQKAM